VTREFIGSPSARARSKHSSAASKIGSSVSTNSKVVVDSTESAPTTGSLSVHETVARTRLPTASSGASSRGT